jgi:hypothetical protein
LGANTIFYYKFPNRTRLHHPKEMKLKDTHSYRIKPNPVKVDGGGGGGGDGGGDGGDGGGGGDLGKYRHFFLFVFCDELI